MLKFHHALSAVKWHHHYNAWAVTYSQRLEHEQNLAELGRIQPIQWAKEVSMGIVDTEYVGTCPPHFLTSFIPAPLLSPALFWLAIPDV